MNQENFSSQVTDCAPFLKEAALRFTNEAEDANDLVQDTLIKAIRSYEKFETGTNLKGWLYIVMKNTFINNYRKSVKTRGIVSQCDEVTSAQLTKSAYTNKGEGKFVMADIKKAFSKLPAAHSVPFILYFEGYKYHEIAERLSIPLGTVKTRIHVARLELKKLLSMYDLKKNS